MKVKGKTKIPDYLQVRDESFTLLAYCRIDRPERALERCGLGAYVDRIKELVRDLPFGKMLPVTLSGSHEGS